MKTFDILSDKLRHFWHEVSNIRPIVWILLYLCLVPLFALWYWLLPDSQFRIPEGGGTNYGDWLYYSIVTITTLGFGDYTPCGSGSQWLTAVEVMCGLVTIGFFLNAVGSMKSEIDVESEIEKQKSVNLALQKEKLLKNMPVLLSKIHRFLSYCYALTPPLADVADKSASGGSFTDEDKADVKADANRESDISDDESRAVAVGKMLRSANSLSLFLDSLQIRVDLSQWPELLEDCFMFVANFELLTSDDINQVPESEFVRFIRTNSALAKKIEASVASVEHPENKSPFHKKC